MLTNTIVLFLFLVLVSCAIFIITWLLKKIFISSPTLIQTLLVRLTVSVAMCPLCPSTSADDSCGVSISFLVSFCISFCSLSRSFVCKKCCCSSSAVSSDPSTPLDAPHLVFSQPLSSVSTPSTYCNDSRILQFSNFLDEAKPWITSNLSSSAPSESGLLVTDTPNDFVLGTTSSGPDFCSMATANGSMNSLTSSFSNLKDITLTVVESVV